MRETRSARRESAAQRVLRARAAGARVRSRGQPRERVGRSARGQEVRLAGVEPRHLDRQQGQRLDRRQRRRGRQRLAHPQVHARRQVPDADRRRPGQADEQQQTRRTSAASQDVVRLRGERGVRRRRLREQARRRDRHEQRARSSASGAPTATCRRTRTTAVQPGLAADPAVPHAGALRRADRTTGWCTCATGRTTASRSSRRTASS